MAGKGWSGFWGRLRSVGRLVAGGGGGGGGGKGRREGRREEINRKKGSTSEKCREELETKIKTG